MQLSKYSPSAQKVLLSLQKLALSNQNTHMEPEHLAIVLINTPQILALLSKKSIEHNKLQASLEEHLNNLPKFSKDYPTFSIRLIKILSASEALAIAKGNRLIEIGDLFLSLIENKDKIGALGTTLTTYFLSENRHPNLVQKEIKHEKINSIINSSTENINNLIKSKRIDPVFERSAQIEKLIQILSRKNRNNPILIGEAGVGRTSIVYGFVRRLLQQKVPSHLISKEILSLELANLVAGTTLRGQLEEKVKLLMEELLEKKGQYILFVQDLGSLLSPDSQIKGIFQPFLSKNEIQIIGLATRSTFKKRIENDYYFQKFFEPLWVDEPTQEESLEILYGVKEKYEVFHGVFIKDEAIKAAIELGAKHLSGKVLPSLAIDLIDEASSKHRLAMDSQANLKRNQKKQEQYNKELSIIESLRAIKNELVMAKLEIFYTLDSKIEKDLNNKFKNKEKELTSIKKSKRIIDPFVNSEDVAYVISQETLIPVQKMLESEKEKLANMENILGNQVIGQDEAIKAISNAIRRARVGLKDPKKPIGSFLFLGPSGVGKTELAKTLTNFLFDDEKSMVRFDMSEFMEKHSVARLIGAPPGYQGSDEGGQLTESIKRKPFSVILFDEIEKAHFDVLNILLQVLDDGRLTDSKGQLVNFNNTVIIMTSNLGAQILLSDEPKDNLKNLVMENLLNYLRPELINRIDEIVLFNALSKKDIEGILEIILNKLIKNLSQEGIKLIIGDDAKSKILSTGFNKNFGARPLKRAVQRLIENPLAQNLVKNMFKKGDIIKTCIDRSDKNEEIKFLIEP